MGNTLSQRKVLFQDLTTVERPVKEPLQFISEKQAITYAPERHHFYQEFWEAMNGPDPSVVNKVLSIEGRNRQQYERVQDSMHDLSKSLNTLDRIVKEKYSAEGGQSPSSTPPGPPPQEGGTWYADKLREFTDARNSKNILGQKKIYDEWKDNPVYSPDVAKVSSTDRIVFIAVTFIIRVLTLYLVEWGINNRMITSFEKAFWYYFIIYLSFIILWTMLVNINKEEIVFHMLFYYINTNNPKGMLRIIVHCVVQVLLLPVPFILKEVSSPLYLNFEQRRNVINTLSNYTLFVWILTSAIALRV